MSASDAPTFQEDLEHMCRQARHVFLQLLQASGVQPSAGLAPTKDSCMYASTLLAELLHRFGGCRATIRGGDGQGDGGYVDAQGQTFGHYWVEAVAPNGQVFVCDITADQFGADPVVVLSLEASLETYVCGNEEVVAHQADQVMAEIMATRSSAS